MVRVWEDGTAYPATLVDTPEGNPTSSCKRLHLTWAPATTSQLPGKPCGWNSATSDQPPTEQGVWIRHQRRHDRDLTHHPRTPAMPEFNPIHPLVAFTLAHPDVLLDINAEASYDPSAFLGW
jgi:hypothetical protein